MADDARFTIDQVRAVFRVVQRCRDSWDDPEARWAELDTVLAAWSEDDNTMPQLASHPMRIVGWATLALDTEDLEAAIEYAGHAGLHVDVSVDALSC